MINKLSEDLLLAVKMDKSKEEFLHQIESLTDGQLFSSLDNDETKKSFWINIYNAYFLILKVDRKVEQKSIYTQKGVIMANSSFSLDDIEHGILRRYRSKYSLGYLPKLFVRAIIKKLAVDHLDYRIHFALNCGAKSCPPIAFYKSDSIDSQLQLATQSFVEGETVIDQNNKVIKTTSLFNWYKADFGGGSQVKKIIGEIFNMNLSDYSLQYSKYDWNQDLNNFA